jgi:hypothetical protein
MANDCSRLANMIQDFQKVGCSLAGGDVNTRLPPGGAREALAPDAPRQEEDADRSMVLENGAEKTCSHGPIDCSNMVAHMTAEVNCALRLVRTAEAGMQPSYHCSLHLCHNPCHGAKNMRVIHDVIRAEELIPGMPAIRRRPTSTRLVCPGEAVDIQSFASFCSSRKRLKIHCCDNFPLYTSSRAPCSSERSVNCSITLHRAGGQGGPTRER